jgi:membrane carboxypeptidase/penicillin-binding protein PbpC
VGNADNEAMREVSGISGAAPIWHDFMEVALKGRPAHAFRRPAGLVEVEVCALSGLLPGPDCPHRIRELFLEGTEPVQICAEHQFLAENQSSRMADGRHAGTQSPDTKFAIRSALGSSSDAGPRPDPLLAMDSPDEGATYRLDPSLPRDAQRILVSAHPARGLSFAEITLLVDGRPLTRLVSAPYRALWRLEPGVHFFSAEGLSSQGERTESSEVKIVVRE